MISLQELLSTKWIQEPSQICFATDDLPLQALVRLLLYTTILNQGFLIETNAPNIECAPDFFQEKKAFFLNTPTFPIFPIFKDPQTNPNPNQITVYFCGKIKNPTAVKHPKMLCHIPYVYHAHVLILIDAFSELYTISLHADARALLAQTMIYDLMGLQQILLKASMLYTGTLGKNEVQTLLYSQEQYTVYILMDAVLEHKSLDTLKIYQRLADTGTPLSLLLWSLERLILDCLGSSIIRKKNHGLSENLLRSYLPYLSTIDAWIKSGGHNEASRAILACLLDLSRKKPIPLWSIQCA